MDYDDELDYASHEDEEFNEESLPNDEYDKLHSSLAELKKELLNYNDEIPEFDLKEALYFNFYDVPAALAEIKDRYKKTARNDEEEDKEEDKEEEVKEENKEEDQVKEEKES
ncbi:uncharacterized protein RJT20DRAFT_136680 [Scheffersomyces xylosifermentans]|uniref:uncharacterized protein n=1 Tax=Scheffersomyces xylosifermentans TaxID=1304137 RepID=UPI00315C855B